MRERPVGSGQWQLRVYIGRDPMTGDPIQRAESFRGNERAAAKRLAQMVAEAEAGKFHRTRASTGELLDLWLDHITPTRGPKTVDEYRRKIDRHIRPAIGSIRLDKLDPATLDAWYARWRQRGLSETTVHHLHAILRAALNQAVKWDWIYRSPADRATAPALRSHPMKIPTPEQLNRLHRTAADIDPVLAAAIALAALTGARRGELAALRWSNVDLRVGRVTIARSIGVVRGTIHEGPTKTHARRDIALDDIAVRVLRDHWSYMTALAKRAGSSLVDDPFVLSYNANAGRPVKPDRLTHGFTAVCRRLEAPARAKAKRSGRELRDSERWPFRFHDLRHFSVSTLLAAGVDIRTVAERHGHAQATMTLNRYAHALPERDRAAAGVLGQAFVNS
jgi:integrase